MVRKMCYVFPNRVRYISYFILLFYCVPQYWTGASHGKENRGRERVDKYRLLKIFAVALAIVAIVCGMAAGYSAPLATFIAAIPLSIAFINTNELRRRDEMLKNILVRSYASSMGGRMRASAITGTGLVSSIISIVISAVIVASMFPILDQALADLVAAAQNSSNALIKALAPAMPYLVGLVLLAFIFYVIRSAIDRANPGR